MQDQDTEAYNIGLEKKLERPYLELTGSLFWEKTVIKRIIGQ